MYNWLGFAEARILRLSLVMMPLWRDFLLLGFHILKFITSAVSPANLRAVGCLDRILQRGGGEDPS